MVSKEEDSGGIHYTSKIQTPIYEPKNNKPHLLELINKTKATLLINEIKCSTVPEDEKNFLIEAAKRHTVFNYEKIADYYTHSSPEMKDLMEKSALVIIDFDKAIENGYIRLCDNIKEEYMEEYYDNPNIIE